MTTKTLIKTISNDPLTVTKLDYNGRFIQFRSSVRQLLESLAKGHVEERKMLKDLTENIITITISLPLTYLLFK